MRASIVWSCRILPAYILAAPSRPGRGGRIRTGDLEYPKLPRYQAALRPDRRGGRPIRPAVDYTLRRTPASKARLALLEPGMGNFVAGREPELARSSGDDLKDPPRRPAGRNDVVGF